MKPKQNLFLKKRLRIEKKYTTAVLNVGDLSSIPGLGRSPGEGKGYPLQDSGLENSMDYSPWVCKELDRTEQLSLHFTSQ